MSGQAMTSIAFLDRRATCECGHRFGVHATDGRQCLAVVDDPDRTALIGCSCQRWVPPIEQRRIVEARRG